MISLSLGYCLVIAPINPLLKSLETSGSSTSTLSTSSDSQITSVRINVESNERYKRKVELHNTVYESIINVSSACRKVMKLSNIGVTDWTNMTYSLLTGYLNAFTNLFSLLGFSSGSFSVGLSSKLKLDIKYDFKGYH